MRRLAIITARSGSKGLKDKNIIDLWGKPLMAYSIEASIKSNLFCRVIVTTDSEKYGKIAEQYGAEALYRGEELSNDTASSFMVIKDVLEKAGESFDYFMLLQPTSPMRNSDHIKEAVSLFDSNISAFDYLVSVKKSECPSSQIRPVGSDGSMKHFVNETGYRRQNYDEYTPNGAIYIAKPGKYLIDQDFYGAKSLAYKMANVDSIDIDDEIDYELVKILMARRLAKK